MTEKQVQSSASAPRTLDVGTQISMESEATEKVLFSQQQYESERIVPWQDVRLIALDVDGVLTDGGLTFDPEGTLHQRFHVRDGFALVSAKRMGILVAWISGRESAAARKRFMELKLDPNYCILNCPDKAAALREIQREHHLKAQQCCFVGDDIPDLAAFAVCGVRVAVADAAEELKDEATYITRKNGGQGAVREVIEAVLRSQRKWKDVVAKFRQSGGDLPERGDYQR